LPPTYEMPNEFGPDRLGVSRAVLKKEAVNRRVAGSSLARGATFRDLPPTVAAIMGRRD